MSKGTITWKCANGTSISAEVEYGTTLMAAAVRNSVPGIDAECGGAAACATCHVLLDGDTSNKLPSPSVIEDDMLDFVETGRQDQSRLSCQILMSKELDGAVLIVPQN